MDRQIAARMTKHVLSLAEQHGITVHWITDWSASNSYPGQNLVAIPTIRRPSDYLFCLHEIGHCVDPTAVVLHKANDRHSLVLCEGAAWAWASAEAKTSLTKYLRKEDWDRVGYAFRTYLDKSRR